MRAALDAQLTVIGDVLATIGPALSSAFGTFSTAVKDFVVGLFTDHPNVRILTAIGTQLGVFINAWKTAPAVPSTKPSALAPLLGALPPLPPLPDLPDLPTMPDEVAMRAALNVASLPPLSIAAIEAEADRLGAARTDHLQLGPDAQAALDRALRRPSVFAPERRALTAELGRPPDEALLLNRIELSRFRDTLAVIVGRVLPPAMRAVYAPRLADVMWQIDTEIYGSDRPRPRAADLPVLDVPTSDRLRPIVTRLKFRMIGAHVNDARRFEDLVVARLRGREYTAPAAAGAGAP